MSAVTSSSMASSDDGCLLGMDWNLWMGQPYSQHIGNRCPSWSDRFTAAGYRTETDEKSIAS
jgi:hypothetical protein